MASPNRNQKVISADERDKISEGTRKKRESDATSKVAIQKAQEKLFEESKANLPALIESRLQALSNALANELDGYMGLQSAKIHKLIAYQGLARVKGNGYSAIELEYVRQGYEDVVAKINEIQLYVPSKESFCSYAGFSTMTYNNYMASPDADKRESMQKVDDYIKNMMLDSSKMRRTDAATSIFVAKASHGMVEQQAPIVVEYRQDADVNAIQKRIEAIKQGKYIDAVMTEKEK